MKRTLLLILALIVFSSFVFADLTSNPFYYTSKDADNVSGTTMIDLSSAGNNGTCTMTSNCDTVAGLLVNASDFDGGSHRIEYPSVNFGTNSFTMGGWFKPDSMSTAYRAMGFFDATDSAQITFSALGANTIGFYLRDGGGANTGFQDVSGFTDVSGWYHIVLVVDRTNDRAEFYINNTLEKNISISSLTGVFDSGSNPFSEGYIVALSGGAFAGDIDESAVWTRALTSGEVSDWFNTGVGYNPYAPTPPVEVPFSITAKSFWDNSSISIFNATVNGTSYNTTTGTIVTDFNHSQALELNITVFGDDWFIEYYNDYNISSDIEAILKQTQVNISFKFNTSDLVTTPINFTSLDTGEFFNVTNGSKIIYPNAYLTNFSVSCNNNVFAPFNITLNLTTLDNTSFVFVVNETLNQLTFLDANDSSVISGANITVFYPSGNSEVYVTNSSGQINFTYIYNNSLEFGNYSFIFNKIGYINLSFDETINTSNIPFSETYNISRAKLNIYIYDRVTRALLSGINVSIAFISLFNETTTTGMLIKDNLTIIGGDYLVYASAEDYKTSVRSLTFTNQEEFTLNFYLLNLSDANAGTLFVTTFDSFFRKITGAKVELLEYIPISLSYISVAECVSNIDAQCSFAVELNTKVYYLRATAIVGDDVLIAETSQNGEIFTINNDNRDLIFYTSTTLNVDPTTNLIYEITESFVNNVSQISIEFNTFDGTAETVCIEYFKRVGTTYTSVTGTTYCLSASSALQNIDASVTLNRSNDYEARVYIDRSSNDINLKTFSYPSSSSTSEIFDDDMKGAIVMILILFALGFSLHLKNISLFFVLVTLISWGSLILFPHFIIVSISVFITIISLLTLMIARKKQDFT